MSKKTIHKAKGLESEFVILANKDVQRQDLSYEAVGLLVYLMSLPDDWSIYVSQLQRKGKAGRDKVRKILNELEINGYVYIVKNTDEGAERTESGHFKANAYYAYATPELNPNFYPLTEKPSTDKPSTVNPPLQSKDIDKENKKDIAPDKSDDKNPPKKRARKRDILFDGIVAKGFKINPLNCTPEQIEAISGRVGKIKSRLLKINPEFKTMEPDAIRAEINSFWEWYKRQYTFDEAHLKSDVKWAEHYLQFHLEPKKSNSQPASQSTIERMRAEEARLKALQEGTDES